ncbi:MAG: DUF1667 domain-containing protein, partial [Peptococcaceae bacterium]|nr:DUF1667 domain-containing protein [Peptococcaceae bacterium]
LREEAAQNALRDKAAQSAPREEAVSRISSKVERTRLSSTSSGTPQTAASNRRLKPDELVCTLCPTGCVLKVSGTSGNYQIENYNCDKGREYALQELESPARHVTSTIAIDKNPFKRLPVRTSQPVPKEKISLVMKEIRKLDVSTPVAFHQTLIRRVAGSGADIIASADMPG